MVNHDNLLGKVAGVDGLKTGFTNGAGFCLAATAQRNNHRIIVVTMGGASQKSRDLKVAELIERGFASLPPTSPAFAAPGTRVPPPPDSPLTPAPLPSANSNAAPPAPVSTDATVKFTIPGKK